MLTRRTMIAGMAGVASTTALSTTGLETALAKSGSGSLPRDYLVSNRAGFQPEGIAVGPGGLIFVGSLTNGDIVSTHRQTAEFGPFATGSAAGRAKALGLAVHRGQLWVTRPDGLDVYDLRGRLRQQVRLATPATSSLNDLTFADDHVFVTDDSSARIYRAKLRGTRCGPLEPWFLATDWIGSLRPEWWFLNGIVAVDEVLIVSAQGLGRLIRLDVTAPSPSFITVSGTADGFFGPDGMALRKGSRGGPHTLYALLNYRAPQGRQGVYLADLSTDLRQATQRQVILDDRFDTPSTVALDQGRLLVVNSQLDHRPGVPPYTVSAVADPAAP